jgi:molybdate transport system substrate-binding protein
VLVAVLLTGLAAGGCGSQGEGTGRSDDTTVTVFAAASLSAPFTELADQFEAEHPGVTVRLSFGGSSDLATQILAGAPADVFASADVTTMAALGDGVVDPRDLATNTLQIAVPPGNPADVEDFADLARDGVRLVVCAPEVPCGRASEAVAEAAGIQLDPVSREQSVTDVLGKVTSGEADAGLVYVTDVLGADDAVEGIAIPDLAEGVTTYRIATVAGSPQADLAAQFVAFVLAEAGQTVLEDAGFGVP